MNLGRHFEVLVVDLDGTLLRSDMLFESFWSSFASNWRSPILSIAALCKGRAALKHLLADASQVDIATLPYDPDVVDYVKRWRAAGGRTALVTATNQALADAIAAHLDLFDEVHGSDEAENLKGARKARFLRERFGDRGFAYMGDSRADLPVWEAASRAVTVNAPAHLRQEAERVADDVEHLETQQRSPGPYLRALRPHQWLKNILIFLPMLAAHQFDTPSILAASLAFVAFSMVASSVYVLNDLLDLAADRAHPRKRTRPFAAGSIPIAHGTWMAAGTLALGIGLSLAVGMDFLLVMFVYYMLTTAYSLYLKRRAVVDICVLAGLYTMRIIAGGVATGLPLSVWLLAFSVFFFFSLAAVKRQAELIVSAGQDKLTASGRGYQVDDLPIISMIAIGSGYVSVLVMALYVNAPPVLALYRTPEALWGVCSILLYWITRTVMITHRGRMHDDPVVYAARDRVSQVCFVLILVCVAAGAVL